MIERKQAFMEKGRTKDAQAVGFASLKNRNPFEKNVGEVFRIKDAGVSRNPLEKNVGVDEVFVEERMRIRQDIIHLLQSFDSQSKNLQFKKGIYIYGSSGTGKTHFINEILQSLNYDVIRYDASDTRNKSLVDSITFNHLSNNNVLNMFYKRKQNIAILMDDIDAMNNGDKGGITSLIKLIRQKKTKRQKTENQTAHPIICIGNYYVDKKIKELMKVCNVFELKTLSHEQMLKMLSPYSFPLEKKQRIIDCFQGDLRKMFFHSKMLEKNTEWLEHLFLSKTFVNYDSKTITRQLIEQPVGMQEHNALINETNRTIVALLCHENIVDNLTMNDIPLYHILLKNICFSDYIDRITFQNQIWQFNEMSSLIKTMYNNKLYHDYKKSLSQPTVRSEEIRFTKILTKYSTEYNNLNFIYHLCNHLDMDKKDVFAFFQEMRLQENGLAQYQSQFEKVGIGKLDIKRIYRYLDQNEEKGCVDLDDLTDNETTISDSEGM